MVSGTSAGVEGVDTDHGRSRASTRTRAVYVVLLVVLLLNVAGFHPLLLHVHKGALSHIQSGFASFCKHCRGVTEQPRFNGQRESRAVFAIVTHWRLELAIAIKNMGDNETQMAEGRRRNTG